MEEKSAPHVLIFPFPAQGHINQMLKLAELLCLSSIQVTFLNTHHNHKRLLQFTDIRSRFARFPGLFRLESISDGAPDDHPRPSGFTFDFSKLFNMNSIMSPDLRNLLLSNTNTTPVTCVICDGIMTFAIDVAKEFGIQTIAFRTTSTSYFWALFCLPKLIQSGHIPFPVDADMDESVLTVPGMEGFFFRRRDAPSFFNVKEVTNPALQFFVNETFNSSKASALILNTVEDLEKPFLSQIRPNHFQNVYTLGPLHSLLNNLRIATTNGRDQIDFASSNHNGLWEQDRSCLTWLDSQPLKSVVYVSFGSIAVLTKSQLVEFWYGLVNSGYPFLWVKRSGGEYSGEDENIPEELREGVRKRGCIVGWAPQEEVLAHRAVGGFLTHSGWNSTLESLVAGVPMICWPHQVDQQMNSRVVGELWKIGVDMKERCDRSTVEKMVRDVMGGARREEIMRSVAEIGDVAKKAVRPAGSSYMNFEALVQDLKSGCQENC
ncbi:hypothetical protein Sjap_013408 [Stephania japonica]|uniref:Glycosyltransferase n=1 Tax=Stephania japonica TaxID=461633 RepID=A0AAP0P1A1_9MAGN